MAILHKQYRNALALLRQQPKDIQEVLKSKDPLKFAGTDLELRVKKYGSTLEALSEVMGEKVAGEKVGQ